jgi:hypothetical protein
LRSRLGRLGSDYYDSAWNKREAVPDSVPWMSEKAEPYADPPEHGSEADKMPDPLKETLLGLFLKKAEDPDADFEGLCQVLKILVEQGVQDEKALGIVRRRFVAQGGHYAAWVLHEAGHHEDVTLFVDKVRELYRLVEETPGEDLPVILDFDLHNWLSFIPNDDGRYPDLLRDGLVSPNAEVRDSAYFFLDSAPFPPEERVAFVRSGLRDSNKQVRYWAARYYSRTEMSDQDWKLLEEAADQEQDEYTRKEMREVLEGSEKGGR